MAPLRLVAFGAFLGGALAAGWATAQDAAPPRPLTSPAASTPAFSNTTSPALAPPPASTPAVNSADDAQAPAPSKPIAKKAPEVPKPPPEPMKRPRFNAAIIQGVDKITAETLRFEVKVGEPVRYKGLILTVHVCETTAPDEDITDSIAHLEVQSQPEVTPGRAAAPPRQVFKGWMFASSPGLNPLEHPVYDLWLIACKMAGPGA